MGQVRERVWLVIPASVVFVGLCFFLLRGTLSPKAAPGLTKTLPDISLVLASGESKALKEILRETFAARPQTKYVLLSFWATWCSPCEAEVGDYEKNFAGYVSRGADVLLVNFDAAKTAAERKKVLDWLEVQGPHLKTIFDPNDALIQGLELSALPFNALIGRDLKWVWGDYGAMDPQAFGRLITSLRAK